jgi:dienelactone hydrolase
MCKLILLAALATATHQELRHLYDYDAKAPLDAREVGVTDRDGIKVHDVSFVTIPKGSFAASSKGALVTAYLLIPAGKGPFPAVLFMHGAGGPGSGRSIGSGLPFAKAGIAFLTIDGPYSGARAAPGEQIWDPDKPALVNRDALIQTVIDLRRSVDFLISRPEVDGKRLGFAGGSYGALTGGVLAGVETRIRAYVLMSGPPSILEGQIDRIQRVARQDGAKELFDPVAQVHYIGHAAPAAVFLQYGRLDAGITADAARRMHEAASEPKLIKWYDAGHTLDQAAAADRVEWMKKQLGVTPLNQAILDGLKTGNVR